jgi:hypothetical protein
MKTFFAIRRKKAHVKMIDTGEMVSGDTDKIEVKKVNGHNGHEHLVKSIECHMAMDEQKKFINSKFDIMSEKIDDGFSKINDKLFELARDK